MTRDHRLYLNDDPVQLDELGARLQERLRDRHDGVVIIKADKEVLHGRVVEVMDIAKAAGAVRLAIATEPKRPLAEEERRDPRAHLSTNLLIGLVLSVLIHGYIVMWGHRFPCQQPLCDLPSEVEVQLREWPRRCLPLRRWKR